MEALLIFFVPVFILLRLILLNRSSKNFLKNPNPNSGLPPGPWRLPIIGNIHQLMSSHPHRALRDLADKHGPLMSLKIGQLSAVIVSSSELAEAVMRTHDAAFTHRPSNLVSRILFYDSSGISFSPCGDFWRGARKICTQELLSSARVRSFRPIREEATANAVQWIGSNAGSVINLTEKINSLTYSIAARAAFGLESKEQAEFISTATQALKAGAGFEFGDLFPSMIFLDAIFTRSRARLEKIREKTDRIIENVIKEHREGADKDGNRGSHDNLLDVLLKLHDNEETGLALTMDNVKAIITEMLTAGGETAATTLEWAMAELMKNPVIMKKAQQEVREAFNKANIVDETSIADVPYLKSVIKETLRLHCPAALLLPRECRKNLKINGYEIPARTKVIVNAWAIARDRRCWDDPESFCPERFIDSCIDYKGTYFEYIPFGAGRRMCPGMAFGTANIESILAQLLYHFDWKLPSGVEHHELDMDEFFGAAVRRKIDLLLIPDPYKL